MSNKIFHNKKALSEFLLDLLSYLVFATAIFFFVLLYKFEAVRAVERQISGISDVPVSTSTLVDYLRTPTMVDGTKISFAELIRLWSNDPNKYENLLKESTIAILNKLEYEYEHPLTKKIVTRGFQISINKQKFSDHAINPLIDIKSKSFREETCIEDEYGCINLGEQFIPISENSNLYIVLRENYK